MVIKEMDSLGVGSLGIIGIISLFMGAVLVIQTASNLDGGLIPTYTVGYAARQSVILEFSPTIIALILAGKVGSSIASELGTMRVTEQIDALEIMGINSANYLILPKIIGMLIINPFVITLSMFIGIVGGYFAGIVTGMVSTNDYIYGIQFDFRPFDFYYAMVKTVAFAFVVTAVPSYFGYYAKGGSVEVGKSSTAAVVATSIVILILNYVITQMLLI
tara:strand:- start:21131 stop:21784 length:654 start_codon:yes stop_codon:yes gene_type:complete